MRKNILPILLLGVVIVLAVFLANSQGDQVRPEDDTGVQFIEFSPFTRQQATPSLTNMQNAIDRVSRAALAGQWVTASQEVNSLAEIWDGLRMNSESQFEIEQKITHGIETLQYNVWGQDQQGVIATGEKLTNYVMELLP